MAEADGQEVLVVDGDEKVQRGLAQLLGENGLVPTVVSDAVRARELAREKYFSVALLDLDTPQTNAGLELTRWFKANAPTTTTIVMCSRKVSESSVEAFRAGAADVIVKSPDQVQYLKSRTVEDDAWLTKQLEGALQVRGGYVLVTAANGGEALDRATGRIFQIALVRDAP